MKVATITDIVEVNKLLIEQGVPCKVHLRDACGRQTMWLELTAAESSKTSNKVTSDNSDGPSLAKVHDAVAKLFQDRNLPVEFDPIEGINFWVKQ